MLHIWSLKKDQTSFLEDTLVLVLICIIFQAMDKCSVLSSGLDKNLVPDQSLWLETKELV